MGPAAPLPHVVPHAATRPAAWTSAVKPVILAQPPDALVQTGAGPQTLYVRTRVRGATKVTITSAGRVIPMIRETNDMGITIGSDRHGYARWVGYTRQRRIVRTFVGPRTRWTLRVRACSKAGCTTQGSHGFQP